MAGEPGYLVRAYSETLEGEIPSQAASHDLRRLLVQDQREQREQETNRYDQATYWRQYFQPWSRSSRQALVPLLGEQGVLLSQTWNELRSNLPEATQARFERRAPGTADVFEVVQNLEQEWYRTSRTRGKRGAALDNLRKFCRTLDSHSNILEILPAGNEYVSLFTGCLKTVIKAFANYDTIISGLSKALVEISERVIACEKLCEVYTTEVMQKRIASLYAHVFRFLNDAILWWNKKRGYRTLASLRENFYDHFKDQIDNIRGISSRVQESAQLGMSAEIRSLRLTSEDMHREMQDMENLITRSFDRRIGSEGQALRIAEVEYYGASDARTKRIEDRQRSELLEQQEQRKLQLISSIKRSMRSSLTEQAQEHIDQDGALLQLSRATSTAVATPEAQLSQEGRPGKVTYKRDDILQVSKHFEKYYLSEQIELDLDLDGPVYVNDDLSFRLQEWAKPTNGSTLSIAGPAGNASGFQHSLMTVIASRVINWTTASDMPVISYFCELRSFSTSDNNGSLEARALIALLYALIRQLIELIPHEVDTEYDFNETRFQALGGKLNTVESALSLLKDLLVFSPEPLFIVIDGLQWLDDSSTDHSLQKLLTLLQASNQHILLTTAGQSRAILSELKAEQILLYDKAGPGSVGGRTLFFK